MREAWWMNVSLPLKIYHPNCSSLRCRIVKCLSLAIAVLSSASTFRLTQFMLMAGSAADLWAELPVQGASQQDCLQVGARGAALFSCAALRLLQYISWTACIQWIDLPPRIWIQIRKEKFAWRFLARWCCFSTSHMSGLALCSCCP